MAQAAASYLATIYRSEVSQEYKKPWQNQNIAQKQKKNILKNLLSYLTKVDTSGASFLT